MRVTFLASNWKTIAWGGDITRYLAQITGIHEDVLQHVKPKLNVYSIAQRMSWAAKRTTTRIEDRAYCLMGLFDVNMPLLYGEGAKAFSRLQTAIINQSDDHTIFAWTDPKERGRPRGLLAPDVSYFEHSRDIVRSSFDGVSRPYTMTNMGLQIQLKLSESPIPCGFPGPPTFAAPLNCNSDYGRVMLLLTYAERNSSSDTDQFCRTDWCTPAYIPDQGGNFRTIFFKQVEYSLLIPEVIWIRDLPARHTNYTLDRVAISSKLINESASKVAWEPERGFLLRVPFGLGPNDPTLTFTNPNRGKLTINIRQISRFEVDIDVESTGNYIATCKRHRLNWEWIFAMRTPDWVKLRPSVTCIVGNVIYILDVDFDMSVLESTERSKSLDIQ